MIDLDQLAAHLGELPALALRAAPEAPRRDGSGGRRTPSSRLPAGTDIGGIDTAHDRQHAGLLSRLSQCVRVVVEEHPQDYALPPLAETATWRSESTWLLATMAWWSTDDWCTEWISTEINGPKGIWAALQRIIAGRVDPADCPICGRRADVYTSDALMVAECSDCQRVLGMRPRRLLTTRQAADRHGVLPSSIRKLKLRGRIHEIEVIDGTSVYDAQDLDAHFGTPDEGCANV